MEKTKLPPPDAILRSKLFVLASFLMLIGLFYWARHSAQADFPSNRGGIMNNAPSTRLPLHGKIDRLVYGPTGRVEGLVLVDRSFIKLPPLSHQIPSSLRPGDTVEVVGDEILSSPNRVLEQVKLKMDGQWVYDGSSEHAPLTPPPVDRTGLPEGVKGLQVSSQLLSISIRPGGEVDRLLLHDGTTVQIPTSAILEPKSLSLNQPITVHGVGVKIQSAKWLEAMDVRSDGMNGPGLLTAKGENGEVWATEEGTVKQLALTPNGQVDGILLTDERVLRFPAIGLDQSILLLPGTTLQAAGPSAHGQLPVAWVLIPIRDQVIRLSPLLASEERSRELNGAGPFGPPGIAAQNAEQIAERSPRRSSSLNSASPLIPLTDRGEVKALLTSPEGEIQALILSDGATVRLPSHLDSNLQAQLKRGDIVKVQGNGGHYPQGNAIQAETLKLDGSG